MRYPRPLTKCTEIARIEIRNHPPLLIGRGRPIPLRDETLHQIDPPAASDRMRKIRDLIVLPEIHAQMRKPFNGPARMTFRFGFEPLA